MSIVRVPSATGEPSVSMGRIWAVAVKTCGLAHVDRAARNPKYCLVRWAAMRAARQWGFTLPAIARFFGVHHTTILYGVRRFERRLAAGEPRSASLMAAIEEVLWSRWAQATTPTVDPVVILQNEVRELKARVEALELQATGRPKLRAVKR